MWTCFFWYLDPLSVLITHSSSMIMRANVVNFFLYMKVALNHNAKATVHGFARVVWIVIGFDTQSGFGDASNIL